MALVLGLGVGLWVNQNAAQNAKLDAGQAQRDAAGAQAQRDAAISQAQRDAAAAQAQRDAAAAQTQQNAAIAQAQRDAAVAKQQAADAQNQANANATKPPVYVIPPYYDYYYGYRYPTSSAVWGTFPLVYPLDNGAYVYVHTNTQIASGHSGTIYPGGTVDVVCSVVGDNVTTRNGESSNWDYVTSPAVGWVADVFVDTGGGIPPRC